MSDGRIGGADQLDAIVVGAGFAGVYALYKLRANGLRVQVLEAGKDIGGTWFWNRYPGARCDVESLEYSYSFSEELQQEWKWPERFAAQPDILRYINHVADRLELRAFIRTETRVVSAAFDKTTDCWTVTSANGEIFRAPVCIMATGNLSLPRVPDFPGLESFQGNWYHTGLWPEEGVDFTGRRVGVIGTGSSGIQMIPVIAEQAEHLFVFQRTPNFSVPAVNRPIASEVDRSHKERYRHWRDEAKRTPFGIAGHPPPTRSALEDAPGERERVYEQKWGTGGNISFLYAYNDLLVNEDANETASEFVRNETAALCAIRKWLSCCCPTITRSGLRGFASTTATSRHSTVTTSLLSTSNQTRSSRSRRQDCGRRHANSPSMTSRSQLASTP